MDDATLKTKVMDAITRMFPEAKLKKYKNFTRQRSNCCDDGTVLMMVQQNQLTLNCYGKKGTKYQMTHKFNFNEFSQNDSQSLYRYG
jgi:hypothetical protein